MKKGIAVVFASAFLCWAAAGGASEPTQSPANHAATSRPADGSAAKIAGYDAISAELNAALQIKPVISDSCEGPMPDCDGNGAACCGDEWRCCGSACPAC